MLYQDTRTLLAQKPHLFQPPTSLTSSHSANPPAAGNVAFPSMTARTMPQADGIKQDETQLRLQQAEEMKQAQQAQIAAQRESVRRQLAMQQGQNQHPHPQQQQQNQEQRHIVMINNQPHTLTQDEVHRLIQQQQYMAQQNQAQQQQQQSQQQQGQMFTMPNGHIASQNPGMHQQTQQQRMQFESPLQKRKRESEDAQMGGKFSKVGAPSKLITWCPQDDELNIL